MKRDISIGEDIHSVSIIRRPEGQFITIGDADAEAIKLEPLGQGNSRGNAHGNSSYRITVGDVSAEAKVAVKGEGIFIEAFDEVFFN